MSDERTGSEAVGIDETVERTRRRLLDAAQRIIEQHGGLGVSLDLTMDEVREEAGVSRSTMYRAWTNRDQFEADVMCDLAGPTWQGTAAFDEETIRLAQTIVAERITELATPEGRDRVLRETVRRAANRNFEAVIASPQWRSYVALAATAGTLSNKDTQAAVRAALQEAEANFLTRMAAFYDSMSKILGVRLRDPALGLERLAAVGAAVVEGMGLREVTAPDYAREGITVAGPGGPEQWNLAAWGFYGVLQQFMELDPAYDFGEALEAYLKNLAAGVGGSPSAVEPAP